MDIFEELFIAIAICIDAFVLSISYEINNIKISKGSQLIISLISVTFLAIAMFLGKVVEDLLFESVSTLLSFVILVGLGSSLIIDGYLKNKKTDLQNDDNKSTLRICKVKNNVKIIKCREAFCLGVMLSLDSIGVGFGSAMGNVNFILTIFFAFLFNIFSLTSGAILARKIKSTNRRIKPFWISGLILIFLGLSKLI
ncbi:MAG: manganese efflux pump [Eubacteriales bacterium]